MLPTIIVQKSKHVWEEAQRCAEVAVIQQEFADRLFSASPNQKSFFPITKDSYSESNLRH